MFIWTRGAVRAVETGQASPLLTFIAGEFAARIAGLWPAPHAVFLTAPAERRHLVCLALAATDADRLPVDALLDRSLRAAIRLALPDAPGGLTRALSRLGETAWTADDYRALLAQLRHRQVGKAWRHAEVISAEAVRAIGLLPDAFLDRPGGPLVVSAAAAGLLAECLQLIAARDPAEAAAAARRWAKAADVQALFERVRYDVLPPFPAPDLDCGPRLRRLTCWAELEEVAVLYENCMREYAENAARGESLLYEWLGEPCAVVELSRDPAYGWALSEARLARNAPVGEPTRGEIIAELRRHGVHVGRRYWSLSRALEKAAAPDFQLESADHYVPMIFGG